MNKPIIPLDIRPATLADVAVRINAMQSLESAKKRDLMSAISSTAKLLDREPSDISTDIPSLRTTLFQVHPAQNGISAKRLSNIKSSLSQALQISRALPRKPVKRVHTTAWEAFLASIEAKHQAWSLSRFVNYCVAHGVEPEAVTDTTMRNFEKFLDATILTKEPKQISKEMSQVWNGIIRRKELPLSLLKIEKSNRFRAAPLSTYPASLQSDICVRGHLINLSQKFNPCVKQLFA